MGGKGLFPIVDSGYDVREADAYIAFLLAEYNKTMERIAVLEQTQAQNKGMDDAAREREEAQAEELKELRARFQQYEERGAQASEREEELKDKIFRLRQENMALVRRVEEVNEKTNPTVEHTAKIIAEILIQARAGGEKIIAEAAAEAEKVVSGAPAEAERILAEANAEAERISQEAREKAQIIESGALERAKRSKDFFAESQRKLCEAYSFLQSIPDDLAE
jgi:chromosome segregation ATPase